VATARASSDGAGSLAHREGVRTAHRGPPAGRGVADLARTPV